MINRKVTAIAPKVFPEAESIAKPKPESASLMKLPFEVLSDVFGFTMTGNARAALRQASNLAVSHPTLSAVLATPGPEQRTYQRLLAQRLIVQAICDGVPEYLRPQTLLPLIEVLPKAERRALFDKSLTWLRQPIHVRDKPTGGGDYKRAMGCINSLMADVNDLGIDELKSLLHAAGVKDFEKDPQMLYDASWLRRLSPQAREQVIRYAEENGKIALYLLRHDAQVYSETEFDRLVAAQLSRGALFGYFPWTHLVKFPDFAKKFNAERFCSVAQTYGEVVGREEADAVAIIKFLAHMGPLSQEQEQQLCDKIEDLFIAMRFPYEFFEHLSASAAKLSQSVATELVPLCFEKLSDPRVLPYAVEAILALWHGVDAQRREQVSHIADGHLGMLMDHRLSGLAQEQFLTENECALHNSIVRKISAGLMTGSDQLRARLRVRYSAELNAYVSTAWTVWRRLEIFNYDALADQEPGLVQAAIVRLISVSNAPTASIEQVRNSYLREFVESISPTFLDQIYQLVKDHPDSSNNLYAFMALCGRADMLGVDKVQNLAQKIVSLAPASHGKLLSSAINLLTKKSLLGAPLRVKLTLWCIEAMSSSGSMMYPDLAQAIALDNHV